MAVATFTRLDPNQPRLLWGYWTLAAGDTGTPIQVSKFSDKTVQFYSASWSGTTAILQGSNDPRANPSHADHANAVWVTVTDSTETAISFTSNDGALALQNYAWIRPSASGGTATAIIVAINAKGDLP